MILVYVLGLPCAGVSGFLKDMEVVEGVEIVDTDDFLARLVAGEERCLTRSEQQDMFTRGVACDRKLTGLMLKRFQAEAQGASARTLWVGGLPQTRGNTRWLEFWQQRNRGKTSLTVIHLVADVALVSARAEKRLSNGATEFEKWKSRRHATRVSYYEDAIGQSLTYLQGEHGADVIELSATLAPEEITRRFLVEKLKRLN